MTRSVHSSAPPLRRAARATQRFRARLHRSVIAGTVALLVGGSALFAVAGAYASSGVDVTAAPSPSTSEVPVETSAPSPIASPDITEVAAAIDAPASPKESTSGTASVEAEATPALDGSVDTTAAIADGQALARVENGEIWAGDGYFRTSFDYILNEGVESTEVIVKVWKGVFQYEEEVASDSTGVFTQSGRYDHTFNLPAGEYTFAALIYHQGEDTPRFDRAYDVTVTEAVPNGTPLSSLSNVKTDTSTPLQATISFDYAITAGVKETSLFVQIPTADGPPLKSWDVHFTEDGSFAETVSLPPGTYPLKIEGSLECGVDCSDVQTFYEGTFTVIGAPIEITPTWPIQESNIIKVVPQPGVIFTDKDGNVLTGDVPVPEGGITLTRRPEQGYVFPEGTDTEKTYEYVPPVPQPTQVTPVFPKQEPGSNVITFTPQPGVIFTDADGNVIDGSFTVTEDETTITATPEKGYTFPADAVTEQTYVYYAVTPTPTPQPTASPSPTATVTPSPQPSASASAGPGAGSSSNEDSGSKSPSGSTLATTGSDVSGITAGVAVLLLLAGTGTLMARAARRRA